MVFKGAEISTRLTKLPGWSSINDQQLRKEYKFPDFATALAFVNRVGLAAEARNHHPDIYLTWGKVKIDLSTHSAGGITDADFVLAAECERVA